MNCERLFCLLRQCRWPRGIRPLDCWDCGFVFRWRHGCFCCVCCALSGRGLYDQLITRPEAAEAQIGLLHHRKRNCLRKYVTSKPHTHTHAHTNILARCRSKVVKMNLKATSLEGVVDWLQESRYRIRWRTLVIMVMNLQFTQTQRIAGLPKRLLQPQKGPCLMDSH